MKKMLKGFNPKIKHHRRRATKILLRELESNMDTRRHPRLANTEYLLKKLRSNSPGGVPRELDCLFQGIFVSKDKRKSAVELAKTARNKLFLQPTVTVTFEGYGIMFEPAGDDKEGAIVFSVESPEFVEQGVRPGLRILEVDGEVVCDMAYETILGRIKPPSVIGFDVTGGMILNSLLKAAEAQSHEMDRERVPHSTVAAKSARNVPIAEYPKKYSTQKLKPITHRLSDAKSANRIERGSPTCGGNEC